MINHEMKQSKSNDKMVFFIFRMLRNEKVHFMNQAFERSEIDN